MERKYQKHFSTHLQRDMEYKTYGTSGQGVLVFPSQDQRFYEWEDNGMIDVLAPMIEEGIIHLICCDSIDKETWSLENGDHHKRIELHERWYEYITEELIPQTAKGQPLLVTGCSMGGYHAGNVFFRRPDLCDSLLSLSGLFHADFFFPEYNDELIRRNSPLDYLQDYTDPHILLDKYRNKTIILCCGQGAYEGVTQASTKRLGELLRSKDIPAWVDIWGTDVSHDFVWWRKQALYFFDILFNNELNKQAV